MTIMRFGISPMMLTTALAANPAVGQGAGDIMTGPDAILCLSPGNVAIANQPTVSRGQTVLSAMGCLRVEAGIRSRLLEPDTPSGPVRVRFYPAGISAGLVMWGYPSSFLALDRATLAPKTRT